MSANEEPKEPRRIIPTVPSVPVIPTVAIKNPSRVTRSVTAPVGVVKPVMQTISVKDTNKTEKIASVAVELNSTSVPPPALPPLNPGSNARPLISSPILKASTCTAKELISPLRSAPKVPTRPAPEAPTENPRPLSSPVNPSVAIILEDIQTAKPKETTSTLNRIASFLKPKDDKNKIQNSPQNAGKLNKNIDKSTLRTMKISNPIPQKEIELTISTLPTEPEKNRTVVMRAQSMRGSNVTPRPNIQTFGSMRQPNAPKRPTSIPVGNRPKSPPPPRPPLPDLDKATINKIPGVPGYQAPNTKPESITTSSASEYNYDDCLNEAPLSKITEENSPSSGDNIYAVIEETPKSLSSGKSNSDSSESVGLLGEIVSEIQSRNFDSIYSTSTLARKKKEALEMDLLKSKSDKNNIDSNYNSENYVNTSSFYKSPENEYSNMGNLIQSSASSTASGYIHPSAVNAPKPIINNNTNNNKKISPKVSSNLSTFKTDTKPDISSYKPFSSTLQRSAGPFASTFKSTTVPDTKSESTFKASPKTVTTSDNSIKSPPAINNVNEKTFKSPVTSPENTVKSPVVNNISEKTLKSPVTSPVEKNTPAVNKSKSENKESISPITNSSQKPKTVGRQVTPVNLRTRKPSPSRNTSAAIKTTANTPPKSTAKSPASSNSPDLVISCSTTTTASIKSPDVLNSSAKLNNKPNSVLPKPVNITNKTAPAKTVKIATERNLVGKAPITLKQLNRINSGVHKTQPSNVATLQQKFENKTQSATKTK